MIDSFLATLKKEGNVKPDILTCLANLSNDEVFTPPDLANKVLDLLPQELFCDPNTKFLDPVCKSGVFLREIARRLMKGLEKKIPDEQERRDHILTKQIFGIAITELTALMSRRTLYCSQTANGKYSFCSKFANAEGNVKYNSIPHTFKDKRCIYCGASENDPKFNRDHTTDDTHAYEFIHMTPEREEEMRNMKFDVIIGNPPYQLSDGGAQASAMPIYQKFVSQAKKLNPRYLSMIIPSRWFAGGRALDDFRDEMIQDTRIRKLSDHLNAGDCFPGVEIKGGICYFLWDRDTKGKCEVATHSGEEILSRSERYLKEEGCDVFVRYNEAIPILRKVKAKKETTIDTQISTQRPFGLRTYFQGKPNKFYNSIKVYANQQVGYVLRDEVLVNPEWIDLPKVIVPRAIGTGDSKSDKINPIYSEAESCCTETYVVFGPYASENECLNVISYIRTKFFHFLVTLKKNTMMAPRSVYSFVPIQDFSKPWTDEELYAKYNLTQDEIDFIKSMVRPMDASTQEVEMDGGEDE